jgi:murein DD-endopeptidase MepM/ murein hydrolase activator NlpD
MARSLLHLSLVLVVLGACVANPPQQPGDEVAVRDLAKTRPYLLPFRAGTRYLCIQGVGGPFSHTGPQTHAFDFRMPVGTPVLAARRGLVVAVREDSTVGGMARRHAEEGNFVAILHEDGTRAVYLHLMPGGALVERGQHVAQGQVIARSGDTGWSATPHLHFEVDERDSSTGRWASMPVAFSDVGGDGVPRMLVTYVSGNQPSPAPGDASRPLPPPPPPPPPGAP